MTAIQAFAEIAMEDYSSMENSGEHESMRNMTEKNKWLNRGVSALKEVAKRSDTVAINVHKNPSGDIDRGYVSGFFSSRDGRYTVYVSLNDGMKDILYRTAKHPKDYTGGSNNTARPTEEGFDTVVDFILDYTRQ